MTTPPISANGLPLEHWQNYLRLAQKGMLRLDQLFAKCNELQAQQQSDNALELYKTS